MHFLCDSGVRSELPKLTQRGRLFRTVFPRLEASTAGAYIHNSLFLEVLLNNSVKV
ncbi:MAG: hypothetical protein ACJAUP_003533 [Cellvibrionaceae bacterium]|jgi:hypothetical protein